MKYSLFLIAVSMLALFLVTLASASPAQNSGIAASAVNNQQSGIAINTLAGMHPNVIPTTNGQPSNMENILPMSTQDKHYFNVTEEGLPAGTSWAIAINGNENLVSGNTFSYPALNGTIINYTLYNTKLYYSNVTSGTVTIGNSNILIPVKYSHYAYIEGRVDPSGSAVSINGAFIPISNGSFNMTVEQGTFDLKASDFGYMTYYKNFSLSPGQVENLAINLTPEVTVPPSSNPPPPQNYLWEYVVAGVAVAATISLSAVAIYQRRRRK